MKRIFLILTLALTGLLGAQTPGTIVNDDRDVLQAVMLSFFKPEEWHSADWKPQKHVVLRTQYRSKEREGYSVAIQAVETAKAREVQGLRKYLDEKEHKPSEVARLNKLLDRAQRELAITKEIRGRIPNGNYTLPGFIPLTQMSWDKRILITDETGRSAHFEPKPKKTSVEDRTVEARATRPTYSPDGTIAIVELGIPWSIHGSDITFVLERTLHGWVQKAVITAFYV